MLAEEGVERIAGAHCYEFFAGERAFAAMIEEEPGTFFLTDFLARHFERLVIEGWASIASRAARDLFRQLQAPRLSGADRRRRLDAGRAAARRLGLAFERRFTGYGELGAFSTDPGRAWAPADH